jgi:hypothetical protein
MIKRSLLAIGQINFMKKEQKNNLENGLAEISRRHNLTIASLGLILPYGLLFCWPVSEFFNQIYDTMLKNFIPSFIYDLLVFTVCWGPYAVFHLYLHRWYSTTPCPNCGKEVGHSPRDFRVKWKCNSCGLNIVEPIWFKRNLSFKKINYIPIDKTNNYG